MILPAPDVCTIDIITKDDPRPMAVLLENEKKSSNVSWIARRVPSILPLAEPIPHLWRPDRIDLILLGSLSLLIFGVWFLGLLTGSPYTAFAYWDGPNYVYAARTLYSIPRQNPWTVTFGYPRSYFACHLPGFPLWIRLFALMCGSYWWGDLLAILSASLASVYAFRRLLIAYGAVSDATWTSMLFLVIPIRFVIYRAIGASEPLYVFCCYAALIFYKTDNLCLLLVALIGACLTRIEGLSIVGTIGLCFLLRFNIVGLLVTSLSLLTPVAVLCLHRWKFGTYWAYFDFNMRGMNLVRFPPFHVFLQLGEGKQEAYSIIYLLILFFIGLVGLANIAFPLTVFCFVYFLYCSVLDHIDIWRYALPGYSLVLLIGFDCLWSHTLFKDNAPWLAVCYALVVIPYIFMNIATNRASDAFLKDVMSGPIIE